MRLSPVWELIQSVAQQSNKNSSWMTLKQQLQHYCTDGQELSASACIAIAVDVLQ